MNDFRNIEKSSQKRVCNGGIGGCIMKLVWIVSEGYLTYVVHFAEEIVQKRWAHAAGWDVRIMVVKSGYGIGGFKPKGQMVSRIGAYNQA